VRIDLQTPEGPIDTYVFTPTGAGPWPAVIVYMDAFGVRQNLFSMAQRLSSHGYVVAVPNLYHRTGPFEPFDPKAVTTEGPERTRFTGMIRSIDGPKVMADTKEVLAHLDGRADVSPGPVGTLGYCMGGGYALLAAGTFPSQVGAAASFHGGSLATERPDSPHLLADRIAARVYIGVAAIDHTFDQAQQARLEDALTRAGVQYTLHVYAGARHGFAVTGHLVYDRDASERHWDEVIRLFGETLGRAQSA
jgi:carboxymethylenebutenolidase